MRGKDAKAKPDVYAFFEHGDDDRQILSEEMTPQEALKDFLQYLLTGSFQIQSLVKSDYQLSRSTREYEQTLLLKPTDHLSLMGLGINYFYMNDFERAREKVVAALKSQKQEDPTYMTWLGVINMYLGIQVGLRLSRFTNKSDPEHKELSVSREKALSEAVKILNSKNQYITKLLFRDTPQEERGYSIKLRFTLPLFLRQRPYPKPSKP